jgi:hypothetical protein
MTATYPLERFIDWLIETAECEHSQPLEELQLTKLQLAKLCAEAVDDTGCLDCAWCGRDTSDMGEYYMVTDTIWDVVCSSL